MTLPWAGGAGTTTASARGNFISTQTRVPCPGSLSSSKDPPIDSQRVREIISPRTGSRLLDMLRLAGLTEGLEQSRLLYRINPYSGIPDDQLQGTPAIAGL